MPLNSCARSGPLPHPHHASGTSPVLLGRPDRLAHADGCRRHDHRPALGQIDRSGICIDSGERTFRSQTERRMRSRRTLRGSNVSNSNRCDKAVSPASIRRVRRRDHLNRFCGLSIFIPAKPRRRRGPLGGLAQPTAQHTKMAKDHHIRTDAEPFVTELLAWQARVKCPLMDVR